MDYSPSADDDSLFGSGHYETTNVQTDSVPPELAADAAPYEEAEEDERVSNAHLQPSSKYKNVGKRGALKTLPAGAGAFSLA